MRMVATILGALILSFVAISASAQSSTDFSGHWRQAGDSATQRQLEIEQNGRNLVVKTIAASSEGTRQLKMKYEIGGR
jgi:hypothetical protein